MTEVTEDTVVDVSPESSQSNELTKGSDGFYSILVDTKTEIEGKEYATVLGIKFSEVPRGFIEGTDVNLRYSFHAVSDNKITIPKVGFITRLQCVSVIVENNETIVSYVANDSLGCMRIGLNHVEYMQRHIPTDTDVISKNLPGDIFYVTIELDYSTVEVSGNPPELSDQA